MLLSGCDIPFLTHPPTLAPTSKSIITSASTSEPTATDTLKQANIQISTRTFSVEEWKKLGPNKYFEFLAPIRMRNFETAYNTMAQQLETLSANITLWNDHIAVDSAANESINLLKVSSKLARVDDEVRTLTGDGAGQFAKTSQGFSDIYDKILKFNNDFSIFTYSGDQNKWTQALNDSMQDMKDISNLYNQVLATYKQEGGPPF